jgi:hypothetical protein
LPSRAVLKLEADSLFRGSVSLASTKETIEVTASTAEMQTDSGSIHGELSPKELTNLPIGGFNNYQSLLSLLPGATPSRFQNAVMDTPSRVLRITGKLNF